MSNKFYSKREYIEKLRLKSNFYYKNIFVSDILMKPFVTIVYEPTKVVQLDYLYILKRIFKTFDFSDFSNLFQKFDTVTTLQVNRPDYKDLLSLYTQHTKSCSKPYCFEDLPEKKIFVIPNILIGIWHFIKMSRVIVGFKNNLYVSAMFINYLNQISALEKSFKSFNFDNKTYVPFNSAFDIENLYTQFLNKLLCRTFHVSHGLNYITYKSDNGYDYVNGLCISANEILVWGRSSKDNLLENYNVKKEITISGNPKYPLKKIEISQVFTKCIVFLARPMFDEYNIKLLKLLGNKNKNGDIKFWIKAHPFSNLIEFTELCSVYEMDILPNSVTINTLLSSNDYDFSITYNTTVYYESMYYNLLSFRYSLGENEDFNGLNDKFCSIEELNTQIEKFQSINPDVINDKIEKLLVHNLGMGINEYCKVFSE